MYKTYAVLSYTNYGLAVHIVNAENRDQALRAAQEKGAWNDNSVEVHELNTTDFGVVHHFQPA